MAAKGRESKGATLSKMIRVLQTVNALSPQDATLDGDPVSLERFAELAGMTPDECERVVAKINYGCGDALPAAWVELDPKTRTVVPHRLLLAYDGLFKLSKPEAYALVVALKTSGIDTDGHLLSKLYGALPELELERFDNVGAEDGMPPDTLDAVADAVAHRAVLAISYRSASGGLTSREVEPLSVWYDSVEAAWSFSAWCRLRNEVRVFRCDRLTCSPVPTGETFRPRAGVDASDNLDWLDGTDLAILAVHDPASLDVARVWRGMEPVFDPELSERLLEPEERENGGFVATVPWADNSSWLPSAVVRTLGGVEAVAPDTLRAQVAARAGKLLSLLG